MSAYTRSSPPVGDARPASPSPVSQWREASPALGLDGQQHEAAPRKRHSDHAVLAPTKRRRPNGTSTTTTTTTPSPAFGASSAAATEELLKPSIVVRAHPPTPLSKPYMLLPLMLLPREHLPLASLDLAAPTGDLPLARRFQAQIRILELEGRLGSNILLARAPSAAGTTTTTTSTSISTSTGFSSVSSIFAIERDDSNTYVLCKLGSWVDVRQLAQQATAVCRQRMPATTPSAAHGVLEPALITPQMHKERGRRRLAIAELQSAVRRRPASQLAAVAATVAPGEDPSNAPLAEPPAMPLPSPPSSDDNKAPPVPAVETDRPPPPPPPLSLPVEPAEPPTADAMFETLRNQYAEALYHSMGSLAYFAKGPLSRARAAFHLDCDATLDMGDLVNFLKSLVLTTTMIDKKYRETVPEIVACLRMGGVKLGSSGLYTGEDAHVRRWWEAHKPAPRDDEVFPRPEAVKYTVARLRTRETQLQMILILEVLALEASGRTAAGESQLPGQPAEPLSLADAEAVALPPRKRSKQQNLPLLLDVHADRLCIWQTTMTDDAQALAESQQPRPAGEPSAGSAQDQLKDFCVDILVPFFSPRLPLVCDALIRKLGGPVAAPTHASRRPKPGHPSRARSPSKPGAATVRRPSSRPTGPAGADSSSTRNLARVLSSERLRRSVSRGPNDAIAQMRSATAAPIPGLKREASEPAGIPPLLRRGTSSSSSSTTAMTTTTSTTTAMSRERHGSLIRSVSDSMTTGTAAERARRKALVEAELQAAISALKKPNRELAGKAAVEAAEKRLFAPVRKPKKSRPAAEVKATPVNNRFHDVFVSTTTAAATTMAPGLAFPAGGSFGTTTTTTLFASSTTARGGGLSLGETASPRVAATPLAAGRQQRHMVEMQTTPVRGGGGRTAAATATAAGAGSSVPDSAVKASSASGARTTGRFALARARQATQTQPPPASPTPADAVLVSSPLQARVPRGAAVPAGQASAATSALFLFETPTKAKTRVIPASPWEAAAAVAAAATGAKSATPGGTGNEENGGRVADGVAGTGSVQSLYAQMGWDDADDLA